MRAQDEVVASISAVQWMAARDVLGGEASHFTPWLADNLEILAAALGLAELTLVETESDVAGNRLDILATGIDDDGDARPVAIENQYGISDHRHLGQLVTYLAQQGTGLGVWVVEDYSEAHLAAMEFLNRTSTAEVGYMLVRVRFTHGNGPSAYQVHFEVAARPNDFVRQGRRRLRGGDVEGRVNEQQRSYLTEVRSAAAGDLEQMRFRVHNVHKRGAYFGVQFPGALGLAGLASLTIRATQTITAVRLHMRGFETREQNSAALDIIRERHGDKLTELLAGFTINWHGGAAGATADYAGVELTDAGYVGGDAGAAARWAVNVCQSWMEALSTDRIQDFPRLVDEWVVHHEASADFGEDPDAGD